MSSVDVIVPCYRYGKFLRQCVESVLTQEGVSVRVLVIDDASPDDTGEVTAALMKEDPRVSCVHHDTNRGHISTYNEGIDWTSADYMMILSADDYLLPGALQRAVSLMDENSDTGFTFGNALELDDQGTSSLTVPLSSENGKRTLSGLEFVVLSGARNIVPTPTAVVRTALQKSVGGYRADLPHAGDMEMWLRLAAHGEVGFVEPPQAVYRRHADNMSLEYRKQRWLPDLRQRKAALDSFFSNHGRMAPKKKRLVATMKAQLSREAIGHASASFNDGETDVSRELSAFAFQTYPMAVVSLAGAKLLLKRKIGLAAWRRLQTLTGVSPR